MCGVQREVRGVHTEYKWEYIEYEFDNKRRQFDNKRSVYHKKALLQLFSPTASVALMRVPRVLSIAIKTAITVSPYPYAVACVWS